MICFPFKQKWYIAMCIGSMRYQTRKRIFGAIATMLVVLAVIVVIWRVRTLPDPFYNRDFRAALRNAQEASARDDLRAIARDLSSTALTGYPLQSVSRFAVGSDRTIVIVDSESGSVERFSPTGAYMGPLGSRGSGPSTYQEPADVAVDTDGFMVADFKKRRVNSYLASGVFRSSFIYSLQGFSATRVYSLAPSAVILFGNEWIRNDGTGKPSATIAHIYDFAGGFKGSYVQLPGYVADLQLFGIDAPIVTGGNLGEVIFSFPFEYQIHKLDTNGALKTIDLKPPSSFRPPTSSPILEVGKLKAYRSWLLTWSEIVAICKTPRGYVVEYQTFDPLRYTIDIWDSTGLHLLHQYHTNAKILTSLPDGDVWLLSNIDWLGSQPYQVLHGTLF